MNMENISIHDGYVFESYPNPNNPDEFFMECIGYEIDGLGMSRPCDMDEYKFKNRISRARAIRVICKPVDRTLRPHIITECHPAIFQDFLINMGNEQIDMEIRKIKDDKIRGLVSSFFAVKRTREQRTRVLGREKDLLPKDAYKTIQYISERLP